MDQDQDKGQKGIKRRTLVAGTAWAVPAVTIAAPAMAYTTSGGFVTATGTAYKLQGNHCKVSGTVAQPQTYRFYFKACNPPGKDAVIVIESVTVNGVTSAAFDIAVDDRPQCAITQCTCTCTTGKQLCLKAGDCTYIAIDATSTNSANANMCVTYHVYQGSPCDCTISPQPSRQVCSGVLSTPPWNDTDCSPYLAQFAPAGCAAP
jgi:hypothetical protein